MIGVLFFKEPRLQTHVTHVLQQNVENITMNDGPKTPLFIIGMIMRPDVAQSVKKLLRGTNAHAIIITVFARARQSLFPTNGTDYNNPKDLQSIPF